VPRPELAPNPALTGAAGLFIISILGFLGWGAVGIEGNTSTVFLFFFNSTDWVQGDTTTCCLKSDPSCLKQHLDFKTAIENGTAFLALGVADSMATCIDSIPKSKLFNGIAAPIYMGVGGSIVMGCLILVGFQQIPYTM